MIYSIFACPWLSRFDDSLPIRLRSTRLISHNVTLPSESEQSASFVNRYKRYLPIVAFVLVSLGVGLEKFGIDLEALSRGESLDRVFSGESSNRSSSGDSAALSKSDHSGSNQVHPSTPKWSSTNPEINLWHIFEGEINSRDKPTGYHSRPGGKDPANARVVSLRDKPNALGVYTASIEVRDGNNWKQKSSSFFPDKLSRQEVIDVIVHAFKNQQSNDGGKWRGPSGLGFTVEGWTTRQGGINTAYPIYQR